MVLYMGVCASAGYTLCSGRTSVYLFDFSLQKLAVPPTFIPLSVSLWNDLAGSVFDGVGLAGLKAEPMLFYWPWLLYHFLSSTIFPLLVFLSTCWYCGAEVFGLIACRSLPPSLALPTSFDNNNKNKVVVNELRVLVYTLFLQIGRLISICCSKSVPVCVESLLSVRVHSLINTLNFLAFSRVEIVLVYAEASSIKNKL